MVTKEFNAQYGQLQSRRRFYITQYNVACLNRLTNNKLVSIECEQVTLSLFRFSSIIDHSNFSSLNDNPPLSLFHHDIAEMFYTGLDNSTMVVGNNPVRDCILAALTGLTAGITICSVFLTLQSKFFENDRALQAALEALIKRKFASFQAAIFHPVSFYFSLFGRRIGKIGGPEQIGQDQRPKQLVQTINIEPYFARSTKTEAKRSPVSRGKLDGDCGICQDSLIIEDINDISRCEVGCGNHLHKACNDQ